LSFALREDDYILQGTFDRLQMIRENGRVVSATIIDFKTDFIKPGDQRSLDEKVTYYRPQLEAYRRAASKLCCIPEDRIELKLLFSAIGVMENLHHLIKLSK